MLLILCVRHYFIFGEILQRVLSPLNVIFYVIFNLLNSSHMIADDSFSRIYYRLVIVLQKKLYSTLGSHSVSEKTRQLILKNCKIY